MLFNCPASLLISAVVMSSKGWRLYIHALCINLPHYQGVQSLKFGIHYSSICKKIRFTNFQFKNEKMNLLVLNSVTVLRPGCLLGCTQVHFDTNIQEQPLGFEPRTVSIRHASTHWNCGNSNLFVTLTKKCASMTRFKNEPPHPVAALIFCKKNILFKVCSRLLNSVSVLRPTLPGSLLGCARAHFGTNNFSVKNKSSNWRSQFILEP